MDNNVYFCPFCRALFTSKDKYKARKVGKGREYKCRICNSDYFNHSTYNTEAKNGKKYNINKISSDRLENGIKDKIAKFIKKSVLQVSSEGFTTQEVHRITHFSRSRINPIIKSLPIQRETVTVEQFMLKRLNISLNDYKQFIDTARVDEVLKSKLILHAIKYGCNYELIANLFKTSKGSIKKKFKKFQYTADCEELARILTLQQLLNIKTVALKSVEISWKTYP